MGLHLEANLDYKGHVLNTHFPDLRSVNRVYDRRSFLKTACTTAAAAAIPVGWTALAQTSASKGIEGFVTDPSRRHEAMSAISWDTGAPAPGGDEVVIDAARRFQPVLGFGAAFTDASCLMFSSMLPENRQKLMTDLFSPQEMNLTVGRCCVGSSDYSRNVYSFDDTPGDVSLSHFSIEHDEAYILPTLRDAAKINRELFLLASPWSPPGWMKTNGSMLGGWMNAKFLEPYSRYLVQFVKDYAKAGVKINALTSQNESETDQDGRMPACFWSAEMEKDFIRDHLGPLLKKESPETQIWLLDHNYDLWKRVKWQLQDAELRKYVDGVAWHGYVGTPDMMTRMHESAPDLPFYWTEGGPDITDPHYTTDWSKWSQTMTEILENWCRCVIGWNFILDEKGKPNIGPFPCGGLVTYHEDGTVTQSGQYWAIRHFSQHIKRGAVRVGSRSDATGLSHVALQQPDGGFVAILTNIGEERRVSLRTGSKSASVTVPHDSIVTLKWS